MKKTTMKLFEYKCVLSTIDGNSPRESLQKIIRLAYSNRYTCIVWVYFCECTCVLVHACVCTCVHACVCLCACVHACACMCACVSMYACVCMRVYACVCVCACVHVCMCALHVCNTTLMIKFFEKLHKCPNCGE